MLKFKKSIVGAVAAASAFLVAPMAHAAGDANAAFTAAITTVTADIGTYGAALVGVAAVGVAFMVGIKYIKKIRGAA